MSRREYRLRAALRETRVPDAAAAEERALRLVRAVETSAGASVGSGRRTGGRRFAGRRFAQVAVALGLLAALVISPAGAAVRDWVGDAVEDTPAPALPALTSLPTEGRLLVDSARGPWVVRADGAKRLLGSYSGSTWSPRGLFVGVTDLHGLSALEPDGTVRWTLMRDGPVRDAAWSPDGYRIAYLDGAGLRVVVANGTGDRLLDEGVAAVEPAWRPNGARVLSYVADSGAVRTVRVDSGEELFSLAGPAGSRSGEPLSLSWSGDGSRLLVVRDSGLEAVAPSGRVAWRAALPVGRTVVDAAIAPGGDYAATVLRGSDGAPSALRLLGPQGRGRSLFEGLGRLGEVEFSPDGSWLLLSWPSADQWLFLKPGRPGRTVAIADIEAQFDPGTRSPSAFPRIAGWCCPPR